MPTAISISLGLTSVGGRARKAYLLGADTAQLLGADGAVLTA